MDAKRHGAKQVKRLSHEERRERRRQIALAIKAGESQSAVAQRFGVTIASVRSARAEFAELIAKRKRGAK